MSTLSTKLQIPLPETLDKNTRANLIAQLQAIDNNAIGRFLLSAQGDIIFASAVNTPAKLAKGTAGQVLEMNPGATAPQWGNTALGVHQANKASLTELAHIKVGAAGAVDAAGVYTPGGFVRGVVTKNLADASCVQTIPGIGFTPRKISFMCVMDGGTLLSECVYTPIFTCGFESMGGNLFYIEGALSIGINLSAGQLGTITATNDGFTINWAKSGSPVGIVYITFECDR